MKNLKQLRFLALLVLLTYVLSACSGAPAGAGAPSSDDQSQDVVFTGTVDAMGSGQWTISGQSVSVTGSTEVDANIQVGDNVKVEAIIDSKGVVSATQIEFAGADDVNGNDDNSNDNEVNSNDDNGNSADDNANDDNGNDVNSNDDNSNDVNANDDNGNEQTSGTEIEVSGAVDAITAEAITINGVAYQISDMTEFKDPIAVGDQVKAHVLVNADGTFTLREIEKVSGDVLTGGGDDNSNDNANLNSNDNGSDDDNANLNNNDNGDDHSGSGGGNGNDDNGNDDNGNDDNSGGGNGNDNGNDD